EKARALVITKGDDDLLALDGIVAGHFPQNSDGSYKGYYPADSSEAISDLQRMRDKGEEYLVIPSAYYWWLDYYAEWREYLMSQYRVIAFQEDVALIVALKQPAGEEPLKLAVLTSG